MPTPARLFSLVLTTLFVGCGGSLPGKGGTAGTTGAGGATGFGGATGSGTGVGGELGRGGVSGVAGVTGGGGSRPACAGAPGTDRVPTAPAPAFGFRAARSLQARGRIGVGDVNGDGKADLVALDPSAGGVLALNDGTGQLGTPTAFGPTIDENSDIFQVTIADLNGDRLGDLAYVHFDRTTTYLSALTVRLRSASGTFGPAVDYGDIAYGAAFAFADIDGDGDPDLVSFGVTESGDYDLLVRRNPGDGSFGAATHTPLGPDGDALAVGDVDGDGKPDLVTAGYSSGHINVLRNLGAGAFALPVSHAAGTTVGSVVLVDADGDGKLDVAVTSYGDLPPYEWSQGSVNVLRNIGNGNFAAPTSYPVGGEPLALAAGDLNADGKPDMVVANFDTRDVSVLFGQGSAGPAGEIRVAAGSFPFQVVAAELNGDGKADIVVGSDNGEASVLLSGKGFAASETPSPFRPGLMLVGDLPSGVALGDLNGDGNPDLTWTDGRNGRLGLELNTGTGTFADPIEMLEDGEWPQAVAIGDVNGDGRPDLVSGGSSGLQVLLTRADRTLAPPVLSVEYVGLSAIALGDLNGDGKADVVLGKDGELRVVFGAGDGTFRGGAIYPRGQGDVSLALGDLTGDGKPDLVVATGGETRTVNVLFNNGNGGFADEFTLTTGGAPAGVAIADLDGDGKPDLAVASIADVWCPGPMGGVSIFFNAGDTFAAPLHLARGSYNGVVAADLDRDGKLELAATNDAGTLEIFTIAGAAFPARYTAPAFPSALVAGDLDGDGRIDLAVTSRLGTLTTFLNGQR